MPSLTQLYHVLDTTLSGLCYSLVLFPYGLLQEIPWALFTDGKLGVRKLTRTPCLKERAKISSQAVEVLQHVLSVYDEKDYLLQRKTSFAHDGVDHTWFWRATWSFQMEDSSLEWIKERETWMVLIRKRDSGATAGLSLPQVSMHHWKALSVQDQPLGCGTLEAGRMQCTGWPDGRIHVVLF